MTVIQEEMLEPVERLLRASSAPFTVPQLPETTPPSAVSSNQADIERELSDFVLDSQFDLRSLLSSSIWIDDDISSLASKKKYKD